MHKLPNLLKSRHGVYYLRTFANGAERRQSLRTKDWSVARLYALQFLLDRAMVIRKLDFVLPGGFEFRNVNTDDDLTRMQSFMDNPKFAAFLEESARLQRAAAAAGSAPAAAVAAAVAAPVPAAKTKLFSQSVQEYLTEKTLDNTPKTLEEKRRTYEVFQTLFGDVATSSIGSEQAISFKNRLISDGLNAQRINKKLSFMKDFFAYAINHKLYFSANPFDSLSISNKSRQRAKVESYDEFTDDELCRIFENPAYTAFMKKPDYHWLPFLGLFTGARLESLASLKVSQVCKDGEIWYLDIIKDKNANSRRKIPLHRRIVESRFLDYVAGVKALGHEQLFPALKAGKNGYSKNCSRRFGKYLDTLGITDKRKVFHSLRATFVNRMTNTHVHPAILMGLVGHYSQAKIDFSSTHFTTYQKLKPLAVLKDAIDRLDYGLNFAAH